MKHFSKSIIASIACSVFGSQASAQISFTNQVSQLGDPTHYSGLTVAVNDVNNDGLDDIVIMDNGKDLKFEYQKMNGVWVALNTGQEMDNGEAWGIAVGDADDNGHSDVFSGLFGGQPDYAKANANGTAYTITELPTYSLATQTVNLADMDGDGDLDFFSCGDTGPSGIWANNGSGTFTYSGDNIIQMTPTGNWDGSGNYGSTFTDIDLDGDLDLYITHCRQSVSSSSDLRRINQLFVNDGNNNYAEDFTNANGLRIGAQSWTTDFQDIDNDGDFDAFMTNHDVDNMLLLNTNNVFTDIFNGSGLDHTVPTPIQGLMRDFDNDMFVDIIVTGSGTPTYAYYKNNGDNTFTKLNGVLGNSGLYSLAIGDLNHDGFQDIYGSYGTLYTNPSNTPDALWINDGNDNNWLAVDLEGTISNRSAIGAQVRMYGPWGMQIREVRSGESYGICNSLISYFGLAQNTQIDSVVVDWPTSGIHQVVENPSPNQYLTIIENVCVAPEAFITTNGPTVLCQGESLTLQAPQGSGYTYLWSNGTTNQTLNISAPGTYMVRVTDTNAGSGCSSVSAAVQVEVSPDETPAVTVTGDLSFCEGESVTLTSSPALAYSWSNGLGNSQSVQVTESGDYSVTITGVCDDFTSSTVSVDVFDAPAPTAADVMIPAPGTANLSATGVGSDLNWYDQSSGGSPLGNGANFTTPAVSNTTSFFVEEVFTYGGSPMFGGKTNQTLTGSGAYFTQSGFYNYFDVFENMTLISVKVYASSAGNRTVYIQDSNGQQVYSQVFNIPNGESRIYFNNWDLTPGTNYRFRVLESNSNLWRDNDQATIVMPYDVAGLASITGSNATSHQGYYYFYYDWEVQAESVQCVSDRTEVVVTIGIVGVNEAQSVDVKIYPNPTSDVLNIMVPTEVEGMMDVQLIDLEGKLVQSTTISGGTSQMDVSKLSAGAYIVNFKTETGIYSTRVVID